MQKFMIKGIDIIITIVH